MVQNLQTLLSDAVYEDEGMYGYQSTRWEELYDVIKFIFNYYSTLDSLFFLKRVGRSLEILNEQNEYLYHLLE